MMKLDKIFIVPDVHGRDFWKQIKDKAKENMIVFLGDYLDVYDFDFPSYTREERNLKAIENFKEILNFKKEYPNNVILLLGNHDCTYRYSTEICNCRRDYKNYSLIQELFIENKELFQLMVDVEINNQKYLLSHAGLNIDLYNRVNGETVSIENIIKDLNCFCINENDRFLVYLGTLSYLRGGYEMNGSIVWADVREWFDITDDENIVQIFGHSQLIETGSMVNIGNKYYCIDSRCCFELNDKGLKKIENET